MPLLPEGTDLNLAAGGQAYLPEPRPEGAAPSTLDVAAAAERSANLAGAAYQRFVGNPMPSAKPVPGFDPLVSVPDGYQDRASLFLHAESPAEMEWVRQSIDQEDRDRRTIAAAGGWGFAATVAAGFTDPLTLASMAIPGAGETRIAQAARLALINAGTSGAQELAMHALTHTRTANESLLNVGASAVLGGVLGGLIPPRMSAQAFDRLHNALSSDFEHGTSTVLGPEQRGLETEENGIPFGTTVEPIRPPGGPAQGALFPAGEVRTEAAPQAPVTALPPADSGLPLEPGHVNPGNESTVGAAASAMSRLERNTLSVGAQTAAATTGKVAPALRLITSPSAEVRSVIRELANFGESFKDNELGIASPQPVERALWHAEGVWQQGVDQRAAQFKAYRERMAGADQVPLSRRDFNNEITYAMRRGDAHEIPEVAEAAKQTRETVFNPLYERAKKLGLLPEDAQIHAQSYVMRQYDARAIRANRGDWLDRIESYMRNQGVDIAEAKDISHSVTRNVLGSERGTMDWKAFDEVVPASGRLKERSLAIPDEVLEPYLNSDIDHLTHSYLRSMAPEVEMTERFGSRDLRDQIQAINDEYSLMMERARARDDGAEMTRLESRRDQDISDLAGVRDRLYGIKGQPKDPGSFFVRAGRVLRADNAMRLLGGATISHFPDVANVITRFGLPNTISTIAKIFTSGEAFQLTRSEAHRFGAALDMAMNTISLLGDFGSHSRFAEQRVMGKLNRAFTIATLETPLVTAVQMLASTAAQHELLTAAAKVAAGGAIDRNLAIKLASAGIDEAMLRRFATEAAANGREVNGLKFGMSDTWADQRAAQAFESAILKDAHSQTLRPSVGDTPFFMSTELGKTVGQFTTFAFAANRAVANPLFQGLARGDPRAAVGLVALVTAAYASYATKQTAAGQPIEAWDSPRLPLEILEKSNLMGWTSQAIFPALWEAGFKDLSRWSDRDPVETLLGPTAGTIASGYQRRIPAKLMAGQNVPPSQQFNRADLHFFRRLMPAQNLWWARRAINDVEDRVGNAFDLPGKSNEQRDLEKAAAAH